jgi:hypothetical protein
MTWSSEPSAKIVVWLRVAGIEWVFADEYSNAVEPPVTDLWYWDGVGNRLFTGVKPWMKWGAVTVEERASFIEGTLQVQSFPVELVDVGGGVSAMIKSWRSLRMTRLTATLATGDVAATVDDYSAWPAAGIFYCGMEACSYAAKAAGDFTGLVRGLYGSIETDHLVDTSVYPRRQPAVFDGASVFAGRRADVYVSTLDAAGVPGPAECVFRGMIGQGVEAGVGVLKFEIEPVTGLWSRKVGQAFPHTTIDPCFWFSGETYRCAINVVEVDTSVSPYTTLSTSSPTQYYFTGGYYADKFELATQLGADLITAQTALGFTRFLGLAYRSDGTWVLVTPADATYSLQINIPEGSPLCALGFVANPQIMLPVSANLLEVPAEDDQALCMIETPRAGESTLNPEVTVSNGAIVVAGQYAVIGESPAMEIESVVGPLVTITANSMDPSFKGIRWIRIDDEADLVLQHVIYINEPLAYAVARLFGLGIGTEPKEWIVEGLRVSELSAVAGELEDCLDGVPISLGWVVDTIKEPATPAEYFCDRFGLLGIAPRITTDGAIGFARLATPDRYSAVTTPVDAEVWELIEASKVMTQVAGEPLLNQVKIQHTYDYRDGSWPPESRVTWDDGKAILGKTWCKTYKLKGVNVDLSGRAGAYADTDALMLDVTSQLVGVHFGIYGRHSPLVDVVVAGAAKDPDFRLGSVVLLTHPCIVDTVRGVVGITASLAIVVGRKSNVTARQKDSLLLQLPEELAIGRITPAALATAWNPATLTLTIPATNLYCRAGETDLTYFVKDYFVRMTEYDVEVPAEFGPSRIDSVAANSIVLTADPFGGAFPATGVVVHYAEYDECAAAQIVGWLFFADSGYHLGAANDEARQWG